MAKHQNNLSGIFIWNFRQQIYHRQSVWRFPYPNKNDAKKVETRNPSVLSSIQIRGTPNPCHSRRGYDTDISTILLLGAAQGVANRLCHNRPITDCHS